MIPSFNPMQMKKMMQQLGMKTEEIKAKRVVIELEDKNLIIEQPIVSSIEIQGQKTFTVMGKERIELMKTQQKEMPEEDIQLIIKQTGKSREEAEEALTEANGDIAEAIMKLKEQ